ncbi:MAG: NAD-dependent epimerase/dehydratase family protein [Bacteroidota bacterium]|nr:NAD-dependent epimerase/dehydratase family protein [Bacteroidota bacterium]
MNLLITGIHGFVGSNLTNALKATHTIYGLDIIKADKKGVVHTYNWEDLAKIPHIDTVIHLAGKAHDTKNHTEKQVYFEVNTELTKKIYDWFLASGAKQFIFFSSVKAAADRVEGNILTEDIYPLPKGPYGESKIAAENYLLSQQQNAIALNKKTYILRPCMIHGPGNKGNLNLLYNVVNKGIPYPLGAFKNKRSFTSIDNLSFLIKQIIEKDIPSGVYQIADDEPISTKEIIKLIGEGSGKSAKIWNLNRSFIKLLAPIGDILHLPLNRERLQKLTENYVVSNHKIKKALDIQQLPQTASDGLRKTIRSFQTTHK